MRGGGPEVRPPSFGMRQVVIRRHGGPEVLEVRESADPSPGPGEVRVRVEAAGVNFADILARMGMYPDAPPLPTVVGFETAGRIDAVGRDVSRDLVGLPVIALGGSGGYTWVLAAGSLPASGLFDFNVYVDGGLEGSAGAGGGLEEGGGDDLAVERVVGPDLDLFEDRGELAELGDLLERELPGVEDVLAGEFRENVEVGRGRLEEVARLGPGGVGIARRLEVGGGGFGVERLHGVPGEEESVSGGRRGIAGPTRVRRVSSRE